VFETVNILSLSNVSFDGVIRKYGCHLQGSNTITFGPKVPITKLANVASLLLKMYI